MTSLSVALIQQDLPTSIFGRKIYYSRAIDSTSTQLKQLADAGAPEGTLSITDDQVAGRGRFERRWYVPAESSLTMSLLFRPTFLDPLYLQQLTMLCALAVHRAIAQQTGLQVDLKWPNDLVYQRKKLAGVLTEASFTGASLEWVVVGVGLNVNIEARFFATKTTPDGYPLSEAATSLEIITGQPLDRRALLHAYLMEVEQRYQALQRGQSPYQAWADKLSQIGQEVSIIEQGQPYRAYVEAALETGALKIILPDGNTKQVLAGEVSLR